MVYFLILNIGIKEYKKYMFETENVLKFESNWWFYPASQ